MSRPGPRKVVDYGFAADTIAAELELDAILVEDRLEELRDWGAIGIARRDGRTVLIVPLPRAGDSWIEVLRALILGDAGQGVAVPVWRGGGANDEPL